MADGQTLAAAALEGLSLGERIVLVARMAVEAHLRELSASSPVGEPPEQCQPVIGGAGGRLIPVGRSGRASRTTRGANV
jgi:hypothetical protein